MEFRPICTKQTYKKKDGTEKTNWLPVGTLKVMDDGKMFMTLNACPDVTYYVFEQKKKEETQQEESF